MRFRKGDRDALESVYREHVEFVSKTVAGTLRHFGSAGRRWNWRSVAAEVPDLVQEVFTRAFEPRSRRAFDETRPYKPYLGQIARNTVVDHLRRQGRRPSAGDHDLVDQAAQDSIDSRGDDDFADPQVVRLVNDYIAALPANLRQIHEALYVRGLSQRVAAASLGIGRQVLRTLEGRLREGLRSRLEGVDTTSRTVPSTVTASEVLGAGAEERGVR
jgi:RNA polymerase sigma-70 factor (ECF subfamily)